MRCWILLASLAAACGARSELSAPRDAGAEVSTDRPRDVDATLEGGRPCGCPGTPTFQRCVLPRMCCPVTRTCEDPSRFNCSGQTPPPCP